MRTVRTARAFAPAAVLVCKSGRAPTEATSGLRIALMSRRLARVGGGSGLAHQGDEEHGEHEG